MAVKKKKQSNLGAPTKILNSIVNVVKTLNPVVKESSKSAATSSKSMLKVAGEMKSPLNGMVSFFSSINENIKKTAKSVGETTGISKVMAKLMGEEIKITKAQQKALDKKNNIEKTKGKKEKPEDAKPLGEGILATLKEAFENMIPKQSIGDLTKILLLATGAVLLVKLATKFSNLLAPVLKFFFETLIPGFQELNASIMSSPTGYLGVGGLVILTQVALANFVQSIKAFFGPIPKAVKGITSTMKVPLGTRMLESVRSFAKMMNPFVNFGKAKEAKQFAESFKKVMGPLQRLGTFISNLAKTVGGGMKTVLKLIPMVSKFAAFGKMFIRFLGPVGLVIQAFVGLFSGITRAVATFKAGGSIFAVIGSFFSGIFDALIGSVVNLLADLLGFVVKKLGFEKLGEMISNIDFTTEGIGKMITFVIEKIKFGFDLLVDGLKKMANFVIKGINIVLPEKYEIPLFETMSMKEMTARSEAEGIKGSEGTNIAEGLADKTDKKNALNADARAEGNAKRLEKVTGTTVTAIGDTTTEKFDFKAEKAKVLKAEQEKLATQKSQAKSMQIINAANNSKGATTVNQTSVHSNGEPGSDHNDMTARHLASAYA